MEVIEKWLLEDPAREITIVANTADGGIAIFAREGKRNICEAGGDSLREAVDDFLRKNMIGGL